MKIQKSINTKDIGAKIKHLRKMRSMTQDELGVVLGGLSRGQISNLETGRRNLNIHQIKTLADYFNVSFLQVYCICITYKCQAHIANFYDFFQ